MTTTLPTHEPPVAEAPPAPVEPSRRRRRRDRGTAEADRGILTGADWRRPRVRVTAGTLHIVMLVVLLAVGLLPLLWLMKSAITPTQDTLTNPMGLFPHGFAFSNLAKAWNDVHIGDFFFNTIAMAAGEWAVQLIVATTGGFALSVLRPKYGRIVSGLVLATLFVPAVVLLVPLYLTILHPPLIGHSLINTFWAVWLPAGASAFNVVLVMRFFDNLPREVFEAARTDGAGTFRLFFSIVLPMSKPIIGVVSVFAINAAWADFLWPNLVLADIRVQPLSVRLPQIQSSTDLGVYLAALAIATLIPVVIFLIFQRTFLRGGGLGGAVKG
ncbi:carbohydrate ABC transporter permease [Microbacterium sp. STN6]|uniref:carbohydrate ABC transporter permease n=1 Tax=Microbacterium sp. STN6 TaxID=2995588 RepID=UPI002260D86A|nr:carbohydrate ABC transporter permease [Microbacterium sp. STN6]MCX7522281.1 carbohydrate ABC transporter permease [Microbacterium sp. STN6]